MKRNILILGVGLATLLAGCAVTPVALAPVGPDPVPSGRRVATGGLEVYSRMEEQVDEQVQGGDGSPVWHQHTGYTIYNSQGLLVKHVENTRGHYSESPERVALPAGHYLVKAQAQDYFQVTVPVTIVKGRTTRVHLDDEMIPMNAPKDQLVYLPNGRPVGWRSEVDK